MTPTPPSEWQPWPEDIDPSKIDTFEFSAGSGETVTVRADGTITSLEANEDDR